MGVRDAAARVRLRIARLGLVLLCASLAVAGAGAQRIGYPLDEFAARRITLIGVLVQRRRASDSRSELVIFLTPRIVNRAEALGH